MQNSKKKESKDEWLSLSGVAEMIGVHPSTIRVWSDHGKIPVHKTSGGHRRYLTSEIENWRITSSINENLKPNEIFQLAIRKIRTNIADGRLEQEPWSQKIDQNGRQHYRESGRILAYSLMNVLSKGGEIFDEDAKAIGFDYATRAVRYGLSGQEAVRAFLFFSNSILNSILSASQNANMMMDDGMVKMIDLVNQFMDQILLALVEHYERLRIEELKKDQ